MRVKLILAGLLFSSVVACAPATPPQAASEPSAPASTTAVFPPPTPTESLVTVAPESPTDWANTVTVEGDYYVLGNPAASVRLIDYSDFL